jgi:hypothetical protein
MNKKLFYCINTQVQISKNIFVYRNVIVSKCYLEYVQDG